MLPISLPHIGLIPSGKKNNISDVKGVTVGHCTLSENEVQTGVTVIIPHQNDLFLQKTPAAVSIINGFGKSIGLVQLQELGMVETPIALTNTFSVYDIAQSQTKLAIESHPQIGREWSTLNPIVFECNDGYLNDIQAMKVKPCHYISALNNASTDFKQGSVGAGRGMSSFEIKGGIGSASRLIMINNETTYHIGTLVLSNFGKLTQLRWDGIKLGEMLLEQKSKNIEFLEKGSIIIIIATDAPLNTLQLQRLANRASSGLAKTGAIYGHGSGDIALAFTNSYTYPQDIINPMPSITCLHDNLLDSFFQATADCVEQSILNALWYAKTVSGRDGHMRLSLKDKIKISKY